MANYGEKLAHLLGEAVQKVRNADRSIKYDWIPTVPLPEEPSYVRYLKKVDPPDLNREKISINDARDRIWQAFMEPTIEKRLLLVRCPPGVGKTYAAVHLAEFFANQGLRVLYAAPRHDMYPELIQVADQPELWYEWLPRRFGDIDSGITQTCQYAPQIDEWMKKGHNAMDFCSGVCGWDYVNKACPYHQQKKTEARIIFGQHQHVATGHPLKFDVVIGDETPLGAFPHEWKIPTRFILPDGMDVDDPLTHILHLLQSVSENVEKNKPVFGPELIDILGGVDEVLEALNAVNLPVGDIEKMSSIHNASDVEDAPYFHIFDFAALLRREATQYKEHGNNYPHRIYITQGMMTLLLKRGGRELPDNIIWLDATGNERIYSALFGRDVEIIDANIETKGKIIQVVERSWGKRAVETKGHQLDSIIRAIAKRYKHPSVIGFKKFVERYSEDDGIKAGHFYAARGTNVHQDADCLIVAGTPQANIFSLVWLAKMIFFERDIAFKVEWTVKDVVYDYIDSDGLGRAYPVAGFWNDSDLQAVLSDNREKEILQDVHRGRPITRDDIDTWLITSTPVHGLEPDEIITSRELFNVPDGTNVFHWLKIIHLMDEKELGGVITLEEIQALGISKPTAIKYLKQILSFDNWEIGAIKTGKKGQPKKIAMKISKTIDKNQESDIMMGKEIEQ